VYYSIPDAHKENILIGLIEMKLLLDRQNIPCPRKMVVTVSQYDELRRLTILSDKITDIFGFTIEVKE
jgi:hypothetical protein